MNTKEKEELYIEPFRGEPSTKLGVIRLKHLAWPDKQRIKIKIGDIEFKPIGFDTYGHPIISEENYAYCDALKAIAEREGKFLPIVVEYDKKPFCMKKECYDSIEYIEKALGIINDNKEEVELEPKEKTEEERKKEYERNLKILKSFKELLVNRKQAVFTGEKLNTFVVYDMYILSEDGHVYQCEHLETVPLKETEINKKVLGTDKIVSLLYGNEIHIPSEKDVCPVCGKNFTIKDIEQFLICENEKCEKVHTECLKNSTEAINYERASKIIDAVYNQKPKAKSEVGQIFDSEDNEMKTCYIYKTRQGTITIYFRNKVAVITWHDNFRPFNMTIFDNERVTKFDRGIHAWSDDDAIRYLAMAKKA